MLQRTLALILLLFSFGPVEAQMYKGNETPAYTVETTDGAVEIRNYPPHIAAEVSVKGSRDGAISSGFRILAGYIFGGNASKSKVAMTSPVSQSEKIAMTSPVTQTGADLGWTVQFMMPAQYTLDTLPTPDDPRIRLVTTAPRRMAVLTFPGIATNSGLQTRTETLRGWALSKGLTLQGAPQFMFYDSPFTLPWNRRNEVAFEIGR
jgi:hypothetical protein